MKRKGAWLIVSWVIAAALLLTSCGSVVEEAGLPSAQEVIDGVIEAQDDIRTYEFEMDMTLEISSAALINDFIMTESFSGALDLNKREMRMDSTINSPDEMREVMYLIDDMIYEMEEFSSEEFWHPPYEASEEDWGQMSGYIVHESQINQQLEFLKTAQVDIIGTDRVKGVNCYVLQLMPDLNQLWSFVIQNPVVEYMWYLQETPTEAILQGIFSNISVRQWVAKDTYFLTKAEIYMTLDWTEEEGEVTWPMTINLLVYNHNQPLNIVVPDEAVKVAQYRATCVLHYDGNEWTAISIGAEELVDQQVEGLRDVWGTSASDIYICGNDSEGAYIRHYDGSTWNRMDTPIPVYVSLHEMWGDSSSNIYAVGSDARNNGYIIHYDGISWTEVDISEVSKLRGIWGNSSSDIFAVGGRGTILHYNGIDWVKMESNTEEWLYGVWGSSATNVFAVGYNGIILHYNGDSWEKMHSGTTNALSGGVWGTSPSNVFAVGEWGTILNYDGSTWREMDSGITGPVTVRWSGVPTSTAYILYDIWGSSSSSVFSVGEPGIIMHYDGHTWSQVSADIPRSWILRSVWGISPSNVYVVFGIEEW
jgi:hypothetical protein